MNNTKIRPILDGNGQVTYPLTCTEAVVDETGSLSSKLEAIQDQLDNYQPIEITGNVTNAADEEDLTSVNDLLKFKNRNSLNGYGYYILRRNATIGSQMTLSNTIYEVRYNFDISQENPIEIPSGCILYFNGGSFIGGTLVGNQTYVNRLGDYSIFNNTSREGTWKAIQDINQLSAQVAENTSDISTLTTQVGTNTGNISTNTDDIRTLSGYVSTNTNDISTLSTNYTNLNTAVGTNTENISTLTTTVGTNTSDISNLSSSLSTLSGNALTKTAQTLTTAEKDQVSTNLINKDATNGMARIELKATDNFKSVVEAQTDGNTIFVIKYDFTLTGNVTVPANCILYFSGGSINGTYTITFDNTLLDGNVKCYCQVSGSIKNDIIDCTYFSQTTDIALAISKCLSICNNVKIPSGNWTMTDRVFISSNKSIIGENKDNTIIQTSDVVYNLFDTNGDNITIKGLHLINFAKGYPNYTSQSENTSHCIIVKRGSDNIIIDNCIIENAIIGIYVQTGCSNIDIKNCFFNHFEAFVNNIQNPTAVNGGYAICLDGMTAVGGIIETIKNVRILNCNFSNVQRHCVYWQNVVNGLFEGNHVFGNKDIQHPTRLDAVFMMYDNYNINICNNIFENCITVVFMSNQNQGQITSTEGINISNNSFYNCQQREADGLIHFQNFKDAKVLNNTFYNLFGTYGMAVSVAYMSDVIISNNRIVIIEPTYFNCVAIGFSSGNTDNIIISDNIFDATQTDTQYNNVYSSEPNGSSATASHLIFCGNICRGWRAYASLNITYHQNFGNILNDTVQS